MMGSTNGRQLVDLDGKVLSTEWGDNLNIYNIRLLEFFDTGKLRLVHCLYPGYRYFVSSDDQALRFMWDREHGSHEKGVTYFVYEDEDIDVNYYRMARFYPKKLAKYTLYPLVPNESKE
jgi:hypothetical protein